MAIKWAVFLLIVFPLFALPVCILNKCFTYDGANYKLLHILSGWSVLSLIGLIINFISGVFGSALSEDFALGISVPIFMGAIYLYFKAIDLIEKEVGDKVDNEINEQVNKALRIIRESGKTDIDDIMIMVRNGFPYKFKPNSIHYDFDSYNSYTNYQIYKALEKEVKELYCNSKELI